MHTPRHLGAAGGVMVTKRGQASPTPSRDLVHPCEEEVAVPLGLLILCESGHWACGMRRCLARLPCPWLGSTPGSVQ